MNKPEYKRIRRAIERDYLKAVSDLNRVWYMTRGDKPPENWREEPASTEREAVEPRAPKEKP